MITTVPYNGEAAESPRSSAAAPLRFGTSVNSRTRNAESFDSASLTAGFVLMCARPSTASPSEEVSCESTTSPFISAASSSSSMAACSAVPPASAASALDPLPSLTSATAAAARSSVSSTWRDFHSSQFRWSVPNSARQLLCATARPRRCATARSTDRDLGKRSKESMIASKVPSRTKMAEPARWSTSKREERKVSPAIASDSSVSAIREAVGVSNVWHIDWVPSSTVGASERQRWQKAERTK